MNTITCPHCKKDFEISEAFKHKIEEETLAQVSLQHKKELEEIKTKTFTDANKKLSEKFEMELKQTKEEAEENEQRNKKLVEQITELTRSLRQIKTEKDEVKLEMEKKLAEEEGKIREDAIKKAEETQHGKIREMEKQLQDALKANQDLERKLTQGSQQLQGEAFEIEFENILKQQYPHDKIKPVGKGIRGGDIIQEVWNAREEYCGKILWELKNTKTWSEGWVDKLKGDKRAINADEAVLISEVIPTTVKVAGFRNGIWVTKHDFVTSLADSLRYQLIYVHGIKNSVRAKDEKMEILYTYLSGTEFKHRVEAIVDAFTKMQDEIEKEKRYFSNKWARDEKNIRQVIDNTYGMHGDFKGIIGSILPQIKGLEIVEEGKQTKFLDDGKTKDETNRL